MTLICFGLNVLMHLPIVPHICVSKSDQHWFRQWLVAYSAPSHYLNQCWVIVNWTRGRNFSEILIKIQNIPFTKMHLKISSAKWRSFCPGGRSVNYPGPHVGPWWSLFTREVSVILGMRMITNQERRPWLSYSKQDWDCSFKSTNSAKCLVTICFSSASYEHTQGRSEETWGQAPHPHPNPTHPHPHSHPPTTPTPMSRSIIMMSPIKFELNQSLIYLTPYASEILAIVGSGNGLALIRRQSITWTNADLLSIGPSMIHFIENLL